MYKIILINILLLAQVGCNNQLFLKQFFHPSYSIEKIEGIFIHEFIFAPEGNEYSIANRYIKTPNGKKYPIQSIDDLRTMTSYCDSGKIEQLCNNFYSMSKKDIFDIPQYQDEDANKMEHGYYHGGDIYYINKEKDIAIAFYLKAKGALIKSICKDYLKSESYDDVDCFPTPDNLKTPFISLLEIDTAYSLSEKQMTLYSLRKSDLEKFALSICE